MNHLPLAILLVVCVMSMVGSIIHAFRVWSVGSVDEHDERGE